MANYTVGYFVGSLSTTSINRKLAKALVRLAPAGARDDARSRSDLPLYNRDYDDDYPPVARAFKDAIAAVDAVLFVTPEYNRSIPGGAQERDRLGEPARRAQNSFARKPSAVIGTSPGKIGTAVAQQHLRSILGFCNSPQMNAIEAYIQFEPGLITDDGEVTNDDHGGVPAQLHGGVPRVHRAGLHRAAAHRVAAGVIRRRRGHTPPSGSLRPRMQNHPRRAEPVAQHREPRSKERLRHGHEDLAAVGQQAMNALGLLGAAQREREVGAANRLKAIGRDVGAQQFRPPKRHAGVEHGLAPFASARRPRSVVAMPHHHRDLAAQVLFVETECLFAVPAVVEICV